MPTSFPFLFYTVHAGLTQVAGICHCDDDGIRCEFRMDYGGLGLKSKVQEARLSYSDISRCQYWKSWFGAGVRVYTNSLKCLEPFPSHEDDHLVLRVKRRHRSVAQLAASEIELAVIEARRQQFSTSETTRDD